MPPIAHADPAPHADATAAPPKGAKPAPSTAGQSLERIISGRVLPTVGAIIVVIGVGLFLKLAYDRGWHAHIHPALRCVAGGLFGIALLGLGELARRRINAAASAGLSGAGIGAIYASCYAAYALYHLVPSGVAFAMLVVAAALGVFIGARALLASVAILSLAGAYLVPLIIFAPGAHPAVLPAYLIVLLIAGLSLSGWRPRPFHVVRPLVWWATLLLGSVWTLGPGMAHPLIALPFLALCWAVVHGELTAAAFRGGLVPEAASSAARPAALSWRQARPIAGSFSTTTWCTGLSVLVLQHGTSLPAWMPPAAGAIATLMLSLVLAGHLRFLRDTPTADSERLGAALAVQCGGLVIAAVALAIQGWMAIAVWLVLGVASVAAGRWLGAKGLVTYGTVVLILATARLVLLSAFASLTTGGHAFLGLYLTRWSALAAAGGLAWGGAGLLLRPSRDADDISHARFACMLACGLTLPFLGLIHIQSDPESLIGAAAVLGVLYACVARAGVSRSLGLLGAAVMTLATVLLIVRFRFVQTDRVGAPAEILTTIGGIAVSGWTLAALLASGAWAALAALYPGRKGHDDDTAVAVTLSAASLLTLLCSLLHEHTYASSLCVAWLLIALGAGALHGVVPRLLLSVQSLLVVGAATLAWFAAYPAGVGSGASNAWFDVRAPIGLHPGLWVAVAIASGALALRWRFRRAVPDASAHLLPAVGPFAAVLMLVATSFEAARCGGVISDDPAARHAAVSLWWGLYAVGLLAWGFGRAIAASRYAGLLLLCAAAAKAVLIDLAAAPAGWRIVIFVGLGLLMLGVAIVYSRLAARLASPASSSADPLPTRP